MKSKEQLLKVSVGTLTLTLMFCFLLHSSEASASALSGIKLCLYKLIPTLLPLTVLSGLLVKCGIAERLAGGFDGVFRRLFGVSGGAALPFFIGMLCSAPAGGAALGGIKEGMTKEERGSALLLSSSVSLGFCVGLIGGLLGSPKRGLSIFIIQTASLLISAAVLKVKGGATASAPRRRSKMPLSEMLARSISEAVQNMLLICGSVIFFSAVVGIASILPLGRFGAFLASALELTSGAEAICARFTPDTAFVFLSGAAGWSGISIIMQTVFTAGADVPIGKYIAGRAFASVISPLIALVSLKLELI